MLFIVAGDQEPVIPFSDVVGKTGAAVPLQNAGIGLKVGITDGVTLMGNVVIPLHCPASGVNV